MRRVNRSFTIDKMLVKELDAEAEKRGVTNKSQFVEDLLRDSLERAYAVRKEKEDVQRAQSVASGLLATAALLVALL